MPLQQINQRFLVLIRLRGAKTGYAGFAAHIMYAATHSSALYGFVSHARPGTLTHGITSKVQQNNYGATL
jgi:hypothetical protein